MWVDFPNDLTYPRAGPKTHSSKTVRNYWFESTAIGANERIKPQAEMEDAS